MKKIEFKNVFKFLSIFLLYFTTAKFGLQLDAVSGFATLVWPPTGIALASLLLLGIKFWPAVFLSAFLVNLTSGAPFVSALGIGIGNTLESVVGTSLLLRFGFRCSLNRIKDVVLFATLSALFSTLISASIGVVSLWLGGVQMESPGLTWRAWWIGDILGDLIVAPLILVLATKPYPRLTFLKNIEAVLLAALLLIVGSALFFEFETPLGIPNPTFPYTLFPFIVWASLRFDQIGNVLATFTITVLAIWGTNQGHGPFSHSHYISNLFLLHSFISIIAITGMILAASLAERKQAVADRVKAEEAEKFLIEASDILTSSLDYESRLVKLARLTLPKLADWCIVDVIDNEGLIKRVAMAHNDLLKEELLWQLKKFYPPNVNSPQPTARVIRSGKAVILNDITDDDIRKHCFSDAHFNLMKDIGLKSHLAVPLIFQGKVTGVLGLGRAERSQFDESEITLIERLAKRAALAIDNAKLYAFAEAERMKLHSLFMQAPAVICILKGPEHIFELINPMSRALVGGRDLTGMKVREAVPEYEGQGYFELLDKVYNTGMPASLKEMPSRLQQPDGSYIDRFFNVVYQPWRDQNGRVEGILNIAVDVTDQVLARQKIERSLKVRDEFLSIASHELRTPLTSLYLQIQMIDRVLKNKEEPFEHDKVVEKIDVSKKQAKQLGDLIDILLDVSRVRAEGISIEKTPASLTAITKTTINAFAEEAKRAGSELVFHDSEEIIGSFDKLRVSQAISNLISNAIKFGAGKPIEVSVNKRNSTAQVIVKDHGSGIAIEDQKRIFERFERAVSHHYISGMGLGLYIAKEIALAHKGNISLKSEPQKGATFIFELPLDKVSQGEVS